MKRRNILGIIAFLGVILFSSVAFAGMMDVDLTWGAPTTGEATKYRVSYSTDNGSTYSAETEIGNVTNYTYVDLPTGSTYVFKIAAGNAFGWGPDATTNQVVTILPGAVQSPQAVYKNIRP